MVNHKLVAFSGLRKLCFAIAVMALTACVGESRWHNPFGQEPTQSVAPVLKAGEIPKIGAIVSVKVAKVFDGDTFEIHHDGLPYRVRLSGIDAPERGQAFAEQAKENLQKWTDGHIVRIEVQKIDPYKRLVCKVTLEAGQMAGDVSLRLLERGLAWHFKRYIKDQTVDDQRLYADAEDKARAQSIGLWSESAQLAPWVFREQRRAATKSMGG
jgi:endonuclease YncB( thermonuclease family)